MSVLVVASSSTFAYYRNKQCTQLGSESLYTSQGAHEVKASPSFCSMMRLGVFLLPRWDVSRSQGYPPSHLYSTWVERGTVRVKCLAQEHNAMSPTRVRTQTARSEIEHTNHEAKAPPLYTTKTDVKRNKQ